MKLSTFMTLFLILLIPRALKPPQPPSPTSNEGSASRNHSTLCFSWFQIITHIFIIIVLRNVILVIYNATGLEKFVYLNPVAVATTDISILKTAAQKLWRRQRNWRQRLQLHSGLIFINIQTPVCRWPIFVFRLPFIEFRFQWILLEQLVGT